MGKKIDADFFADRRDYHLERVDAYIKAAQDAYLAGNTELGDHLVDRRYQEAEQVEVNDIHWMRLFYSGKG